MISLSVKVEHKSGKQKKMEKKLMKNTNFPHVNWFVLFKIPNCRKKITEAKK